LLDVAANRNARQHIEAGASRRLMQDILANEVEHAEEMKTLSEAMGKGEKTQLVKLQPKGKGRPYENNNTGYFDPAFAGRVAQLAV
jgi:hypothetical protein